MRSALPVHPDALFRCELLACTLRARVCVRRQLLAERDILGAPTTRSCQRRADPNRPIALARHDGKRGAPASDFATCLRCRQGARIRARLGDACATEVRSGGRRDHAAYAARRALNPLPSGNG